MHTTGPSSSNRRSPSTPWESCYERNDDVAKLYTLQALRVYNDKPKRIHQHISFIFLIDLGTAWATESRSLLEHH